LVCEDGGQAADLEQILLTAIDFGRASFIAQATAEVEGTDKIAEAQRAYAERIATKVSELLTPRREDRKLIIDAESGMSVASTGMLVGLLLPAVQAAREAARRTQAANHLKQIGLALHNYHAVHGHFPPPAITDENGRPLLSWRVAILPYLESRDLHDRFRLDEPWDSDHNRRLIDQMPGLFSDASVPVPPGQTVFQMVTGEAIGLQPQGPTRLAELTDGTSNTVLVVETDQADAVPWTAPRDVDIDLNTPLAKMGHSHSGGFQVLFADGSVRFISHNIDPQLFRSLLTRAGGERLGNF
jgi:prepilin-type processing-associated H-X9-DG protein